MPNTLPQEPKEFFYSLLGLIRLLHMSYHHCHTNTQGPTYYGDHLLLQRLYDAGTGSPDLVGELDSLMEKMKGLGLQGPVRLDEILKRLQDYYGHFQLDSRVESVDPARFFPALLDIEVELQRVLTDFNSLLAEQPDLLLENNDGLINLLQGTADAHQANIYLIQQRLAR